MPGTREEPRGPDRIVVVEDDHELRTFLAEVLQEAGFSTETFSTADKALASLTEGLQADLVVTDVLMPGMRGDELLRELRHRRPELDVIVITAFASVDAAIELVKAGAYDYLPKPFGPDQLLLRVKRALTESRLRREIAELIRTPSAGLPGFIGASRQVQELFAIVRRSADSNNPVLITGESGTGKELVARAVHLLSGRRNFVPINCGALPDTLLESELFGHQKGAFTGADRETEGLFEAAHGGTLFLDELSELPLPLQPKLLRALEEGEVRRVGATRTRHVDVRIVAASNRDLEEEVRQGRLREDLYWRVNAIHVEIPPLRERAADIPLLAEHFLSAAAASNNRDTPLIHRDAMAAITRYGWPGNARELRHAMERALVLSSTDDIRVEDLPPRIREAGGLTERVTRAAERSATLEDVERTYVLETLRRLQGNKSRAAEVLGIDRKTLYRKLEGYATPDEAEGTPGN